MMSDGRLAQHDCHENGRMQYRPSVACASRVRAFGRRRQWVFGLGAGEEEEGPQLLWT